MTSEAPFTLRAGTAADAEAVAAVFSPSRRLLDFLPDLHDASEDRWFIEEVVFRDCDVLVAERGGRIVSFLALEDHEASRELRLLFTHPDHLGRGAGGLLVEAAKTSGAPRLELWCFQANWRARRFYETRGFRAVRFTDGAENEERTPDVLYRWERDDR